MIGTEYVSFCNTDKVFKVTKRVNGVQKFLGSNKAFWCFNDKGLVPS